MNTFYRTAGVLPVQHISGAVLALLAVLALAAVLAGVTITAARRR